MKMHNIYSRTGDSGETSLYSGERIAKSSPRVDAYGTVDELQAALGLARALVSHEDIKAVLYEVEQKLVQVMAELATIGSPARVGAEDVEGIEALIDGFEADVELGTSFTTPGKSAGSAALHVARTTARRCERVLLSFNEQEPLNPALLRYANRVSDLCFVLASCEDSA